jgi:hypothetical protein
VLKLNTLQPSIQRGGALHRPASVVFSVLRDSTFMGNQQHTQTVIRFGSFEADLHTQELRRRGTLLRLPSQWCLPKILSRANAFDISDIQEVEIEAGLTRDQKVTMFHLVENG